MPEYVLFISVMMKRPPMFGGFHIAAAVLSIVIPALLVMRFPAKSRSDAVKRLSVCGWILLVMEVYKQVFLYTVVNGMRYNFWYFPFQLCSMAMYLCILLPFLSKSGQDTVLNFLYEFSLPGALLALVFPEDFLREYVSLTLHGFLWHALLVYIALFVLKNNLVTRSWRGYSRAAGLYLFLAACAILLNTVLQRFAAPGFTPNLFYLSPYIKTGQIFFRDIAERFGILTEMVIYVSLYLLFCALFHGYARMRPSGSQ